MAISSQHAEAAVPEPLVRTVILEVPNLQNPKVAEEYKRQRAIINDALQSRGEEMAFWESTQSHQGWT